MIIVVINLIERLSALGEGALIAKDEKVKEIAISRSKRFETVGYTQISCQLMAVGTRRGMRCPNDGQSATPLSVQVKVTEVS